MHEGGFDCKRSNDGEIYFLDRRAERLKTSEPSKRKSIEETLAWMYRKFESADVSAETCQAKWYAGEQMDMQHAVSAMRGA